MLERILPPEVAVSCAAEEIEAELYEVESSLVANAVEGRRREFATGRACARNALAKLGIMPAPIPAGERGEPLWPDGIVGSITHCEVFRAAAVAHASQVMGVGIDAEPNAPLPAGLLGDIALPQEQAWIRALAGEVPGTCWDRLLFTIKEAVYKVWFPIAHRWLGFEDALVEIDRERGSFSVRLLVPGPMLGGTRLTGFEGRWLAQDGILLAAIALVSPADEGGGSG